MTQPRNVLEGLQEPAVTAFTAESYRENLQLPPEPT